jgi:hypothetical protein
MDDADRRARARTGGEARREALTAEQRITIARKAQKGLTRGMTKAERSAYFAELGRRSGQSKRGEETTGDERPIVHGLRSSYASRGCRCDECRAAQAAYMVKRARKLRDQQ